MLTEKFSPLAKRLPADLMKFLISISVVLSALCVSEAVAQTSRTFDNFDLSSGVKVYSPSGSSSDSRTASQPNTPSANKGRRGRGARSNTSETTPFTARTASVRMVMSSRNHMGSFTTGNPTVDSYIVESSRRYGIDPLLIYAQMHQESSFKQRAISHKGARGLMQLMPATARRFGVSNIFDPQQNIDAGVKYMRWLLDKFGQNLELALAGYNAGEGAVMKYGNSIPPYRETREYVRRITARYASISDPRYIRRVPVVSSQQALKYEDKEARPLTAYEPRTVAIRLPDGTMRLVND